MDITYKIENYYPLEDRVFVVYQAEGYEPLGGWVYIPETATSEEIVAAVEASAPLSKWRKGKNSAVAALLNQDRTGVAVESVPEPVAPAATESAEVLSRRKRKFLLFSADWTQLVDAPLSDAQRTAWAEYRQALRDVPDQVGFPDQIVWPVIPSV
jgi:hypothetical protein